MARTRTPSGATHSTFRDVRAPTLMHMQASGTHVGHEDADMYDVLDCGCPGGGPGTRISSPSIRTRAPGRSGCPSSSVPSSRCEPMGCRCSSAGPRRRA
eukprot:111958-Prymnesium_polylepis.1